MTAAVVFVHGAGRSGADAWPLQADAFPGADFLTLPGFGSQDPSAWSLDAAVEILRAAAGRESVVVAASFGGVVTARARLEGVDMSGVVLAEPALFSVARGAPAVEAMIARVEPTYEGHDSDGEFWAAFMTALTGSPTAEPETESDILQARRFSALGPPWAVPVPRTAFRGVPVTVVTGAWNTEYEEVAAALVDGSGAEHVRLPGHQHRVADHPGFDEVIRRMLGRVARDRRLPRRR